MFAYSTIEPSNDLKATKVHILYILGSGIYSNDIKTNLDEDFWWANNACKSDA